jgi:uncharacterized protein (TIGR03492 family)
LLRHASVVLGQAGTANEAAAAAGVPVVAFEDPGDARPAWYRRRQSGLLGEAMVVLPADTDNAATAVLSLLGDSERRVLMAAAGRERMGAPGAARRIAERIVAIASTA